MHLQVTTLSDISDGNGQTVNRKIMEGQRPNDRESPRDGDGISSQAMGKISTDTLCDEVPVNLLVPSIVA